MQSVYYSAIVLVSRSAKPAPPTISVTPDYDAKHALQMATPASDAPAFNP
ncbi:hypothetical protein CsSME_00003717 [Camellia sinensis var. sinensis]